MPAHQPAVPQAVVPLPPRSRPTRANAWLDLVAWLRFHPVARPLLLLLRRVARVPPVRPHSNPRLPSFSRDADLVRWIAGEQRSGFANATRQRSPATAASGMTVEERRAYLAAPFDTSAVYRVACKSCSCPTLERANTYQSFSQWSSSYETYHSRSHRNRLLLFFVCSPPMVPSTSASIRFRWAAIGWTLPAGLLARVLAVHFTGGWQTTAGA